MGSYHYRSCSPSSFHHHHHHTSLSLFIMIVVAALHTILLHTLESSISPPSRLHIASLLYICVYSMFLNHRQGVILTVKRLSTLPRPRLVEILVTLYLSLSIHHFYHLLTSILTHLLIYFAVTGNQKPFTQCSFYTSSPPYHHYSSSSSIPIR